jgi:squalene cyclase/subtilisin family serine protease
MAEQDVNLAVFTPRLIKALTSGVAPQASTPVNVLIKFQTDEAFNDFLKKDAQISVRAGGSGGKKFKVVRALKSIRTVAVEIRVDVLQALSTFATDVGIQTIDEDFRVHGFLDVVSNLEKIEIARHDNLHGEGIYIAILDTGIDDVHPDLVGVVQEHVDLTTEGPEDKVGHGTHVASIVAGRGIVDQSKKGIADKATLLAVKVLGSNGNGSASTVIAGIEAAVEKGVNIINMSLGAAGNFDGTDPLSESSNWAVSQGVTVCAAAGNCGPAGSVLQCDALGDKTIGTPGCAADVITVGALNKDLSVAGYSSRGPTWGGIVKPDVMTIGSMVVAARAKNTSMGTPINQTYTQASGTSMATPVCSGLVALLLEQAHKNGKNLKPHDVKEFLRSHAVPFTGLDPNTQGQGFITAEGVLGAAVPEAFALESFKPEAGDEAFAKTSQTWFLVLRNTYGSDLFDVEAHFSEHPHVTINPPNDSFGTMKSGVEEPVGFIVQSDTSGDFTLDVRIDYRLRPAGDVLQEMKSISIHFNQKTAPVSTDEVDAVLNDTIAQIVARQNEDGTWAGRIMYNAWTNGMYCILHRLLDIPGEPKLALDWLEEHRNGVTPEGKPDGTWGIIDDPSLHFLEATIAAEIALEIWGRGRKQDVWDFIDNVATGRLASALSLVDPFTQIFAALASQYAPPGSEPYFSMSNVLAPPLEMVIMPRFLPFSIPKLAGTWGQDALMALTVITTKLSGRSTSLAKEILLKKAEAFLLQSQNEDGSWYDTILPTMIPTLAMYLLGYDLDHPVMKKAIGFLQQLQRVDGYIARYRLPVWDTCLICFALREADMPKDHPVLRRAAKYLMASQRSIDGGIPFQKENVNYPDMDDTAYAILALEDIDMGEEEKKKQKVIADGLRWLLFMQGTDGGWAAFAKDQARAIKGRIPLFKDDPPVADVTGHVLSALKLASRVSEVEEAKAAIDQGVSWLQRYQLAGGEWFGRWGLTYTYGTSAVLLALHDIGEDMDQNFVRRAVEYLLQTQQADGGWGEGFETYYNLEAKESVASTVDQTAWSLLGLLAVPKTRQIEAAIEKGIQFLLNQYDSQKGWPEDKYTVGAIWVYKNTIYPLAWGVWALAKYRRQKRG